MIYGQDVSNWQGAYAWPSGLQFGFAKATESVNYTDVQFTHNWAALKAKGMVRGAYHFGHPANNPTSEAQYFLKAVRARGLEAGDLLCLDLEVSNGQSASRIQYYAKTWCEYVKSHTGVTPILYTYRSFATSYCAGLGGYPLWIADPTTAGRPRVPSPWRSWVLHQYSTAGGIDHDCSNLSKAQLAALGVGGAPTPMSGEDDMKYVSYSTKAPIKGKKGDKPSIVWDKVIDGPKVEAGGIIPMVPSLSIVEFSCSVPHQLYAQDDKGNERDLGNNPVSVVALYEGDRLFARLLFDRDEPDGVTPWVKAGYGKKES